MYAKVEANFPLLKIYFKSYRACYIDHLTIYMSLKIEQNSRMMELE